MMQKKSLLEMLSILKLQVEIVKELEDLVYLFKNNDYYVYKVNGKIVAGIQVFDVHWRIDAMPGLKGKLLVKLLPYIPLIKRIINPKDYQFLATEGLFWENGYESKVQELLETVLAEKNKNSMLMWFDDIDDRMIDQFNNMNVGLMQKMKADNSIEILALWYSKNI